jgi:glycogen phosphorylase
MKERDTHEYKIAYFSMEVGLDVSIPTYAGGLGILAGDTLKSCADLQIPIVGVTLLNRNGYFYQKIDQYGNQHEEPVRWVLAEHMTCLEPTVTVQIEDRTVKVRAWLYTILGESGAKVPVLFLDTRLDSNSEYDKALSDYLYSGDRQYRFCQEMILGIGGARMLEALGYDKLEKYHLNEGHAALCTIELLHKYRFDVEHVKEKCVFTTHTPVESGHDTFDVDMVGRMIKDYYPWQTKYAEHDGKFNMTYLALNLSNYVNGVAKKHKQVSLAMFPGREIHAITNGVHAGTWVSDSFAQVFTRHIPDWKHDPFSLRSALSISDDEIWSAHRTNKQILVNHVNEHYNAGFDADTFTLGFARRATAYKRADLLFSDIEWLKALAGRVGKIQLVFGGKAHISDGIGKDLIRKLYSLKTALGPNIRMVYIENYDMRFGKMLTSGVDVWLNTPLRPLEASGTSGMKAALNGVPSFSVLDGWWIEGCVDGLTGWSIGPYDCGQGDNSVEDARDLYTKLEKAILPIYYTDKARWISIMRHSIAMNGSFFNTHRMVNQYVTNAYFK